MAPKQQTVTVAGERLRLTNLDKVLFPASGTTKAEVIEYWQSIAAVMIPHTARRPITRKRWPDGVGTPEQPTSSFFRKDLEDSAPAWVPRLAQQHEDHTNVYPVLDDDAGRAVLAWFGQLAALELHVPQWRFEDRPGPDVEPSPSQQARPDRLVLDLDPGEGIGLAECAQVARWCREILEDMGLDSVPVTSGSKGVHLYAGLDGSSTSDQISEVAQELAKSLETDHPDEVVSSMSKAERAGKVFIDWSQNNRNKTTIAPYSLRGRTGSETGPHVAAPRTWQELEDSGLGQLDFRQVRQRLDDGVEPMAELGEGGSAAQAPEDPEDRLSRYRSKREASRTSEPVPQDSPAAGQGSPAAGEDSPIFVIQEHHATALHYDTRLEHEGVLASWAVPKGPPLRRGTQRLAVQTEDHPMEYATFEGTIPEDQYGGGEVSIWDTGTMELEKWEDDKVVAVLHGRDDGGLRGRPRRYALIRTDDDGNWIMRLMKDQPTADAGVSRSSRGSRSSRASHAARRAPSSSPTFPSVMLATLGDPADIGGSGWVFEGKWDGYRVLARLDDDGLTLRSRNGEDMTATFPELAELTGLARPGTVFDGEVVALNSSSRPDFGLLQKRGRLTEPRQIERAAEKIPVHYMAFDVLHTPDHGDLTTTSYAQRREILPEQLSAGEHVQVPGDLGDSLDEAMEVSRDLQLEGLLAKRRDSAYRPGKRSRDWIKIKHADHADVVVIGWRQGKGSRAQSIGSLLLGRADDDGGLVYAGRVGTGFSAAELEELRTRLEKMVRKTPPASGVPRADAADATWVTPKLDAEVKHSGITRDGRLRQPVWRTLKNEA